MIKIELEKKLLERYSFLLEKQCDYHEKLDFLEKHLDSTPISNIGFITHLIALKPDVDFDELQKFFEDKPDFEIKNLVNILKHLLEGKGLDRNNKAIYENMLRFLSKREIIDFIVVVATGAEYYYLYSIASKHNAINHNFVANIVNAYENAIIYQKKMIDDYSRKISAFKQLIEKFKTFDEHPFYELNKDVTNSLDKETLIALYSFMVEHQNTKDMELTGKLTPSLTPTEQLEEVLNKYNLSLKLFKNEKLLTFGNIDNISEILKIFKSANIDFSLFKADAFEDILTFANPKDVRYAMVLLSKNAIDDKFIYENPGIFLNESNELKDEFNTIPIWQKVHDNFELISALNIEFDANYNNKVLLLDKNVLIGNIKLLKQYFNKLTNTNLWCSLLINPELFKIIDFFSETGITFENINFNNLDGVNVDNLIKRMYLALNCNLPIFKGGMIDLELLAKIEEQNLDEYIPNETHYSLPIDILDEFRKTKVTGINDNIINLINFKEFYDSRDGNIYFGDDIILSKTRLLRNLSILYCKNDKYSMDDLIFYSLIYGSFLSNEEIKKIKSHIKKEK